MTEPFDPDPVDLKFNEQPVCPYCGYIRQDAWEINFGSNLFDGEAGIYCGECGKEYRVCREVEVTYSTYTLESLQPKG